MLSKIEHMNDPYGKLYSYKSCIKDFTDKMYKLQDLSIFIARLQEEGYVVTPVTNDQNSLFNSISLIISKKFGITISQDELLLESTHYLRKHIKKYPTLTENDINNIEKKCIYSGYDIIDALANILESEIIIHDDIKTITIISPDTLANRRIDLGYITTTDRYIAIWEEETTSPPENYPIATFLSTQPIINCEEEIPTYPTLFSAIDAFLGNAAIIGEGSI